MSQNSHFSNENENIFCSIWNFSTSLNFSPRTLSAANMKYGRTQCDYFCSRSSSLKKYMLIYSGEKPFRCDLCNYSCTQAHNLKSQKLTHTLEKSLLHKSSAAILVVNLMIWSITCFHTPARNLLPASNATSPANCLIVWRSTLESTMLKEMHEKAKMKTFCLLIFLSFCLFDFCLFVSLIFRLFDFLTFRLRLFDFSSIWLFVSFFTTFCLFYFSSFWLVLFIFDTLEKIKQVQPV